MSFSNSLQSGLSPWMWIGSVKIGVIPAAGKGKRISPLSEIFPKPMIPILDRPILEYVIHRMVHEFGIEQIYLIVGYRQEILKDYFKDGRRFGVKIEYIEQREQKGIAHAISLAESHIDQPFLVILGDDFTLGSVKHLWDTFNQEDAYVVEAVTEEHDFDIIRRTCAVSIDKNNRITRITEKPTDIVSSVRGCGLYIFDPIIFEYIRKTPRSTFRTEIEITNTIDIIANSQKAYGTFIDGVNININTHEDLIMASKKLIRMLNSSKEIDLGKIYSTDHGYQALSFQ